MCIYRFKLAGFGFGVWVLVEWAGEELCGVCSRRMLSLHFSDMRGTALGYLFE
ncbi:hypothetical protein L873DRAFT_1814514 [Choiromyces venosus 120613-1]|uniref:Uncharacterized protein n=1 Tax=Choiromyces venosus 120613-1 TaxID=1336337 RepID=A0A3N4JKG1_9PEZI|nr:hypothetical protein L873DRAFT_1814514 [Choiromyces venosus 120613-1]